MEKGYVCIDGGEERGVVADGVEGRDALELRPVVIVFSCRTNFGQMDLFMVIGLVFGRRGWGEGGALFLAFLAPFPLLPFPLHPLPPSLHW